MVGKRTKQVERERARQRRDLELDSQERIRETSARAGKQSLKAN